MEKRDELRERFENMLIDISQAGCKTWSDYAIQLMHSAYQLDRSEWVSVEDGLPIENEFVLSYAADIDMICRDQYRYFESLNKLSFAYKRVTHLDAITTKTIITMKVKINKETGFGEVENPFYLIEHHPDTDYEEEQNERYAQFAKNNSLPVISQSGEILTEGTWECEKTTTDDWRVAGWNVIDVYRVILPTQPDVKETVNIQDAAINEVERLPNIHKLLPENAFIHGSIFGANWHKQQVLAEIEKCNRGDQNMIRLIKVIKEM